MTGTSADSSSGADEPEVHGLARKLTCNVFFPTILGVLAILLCQVFLTLEGSAGWGEDTKSSMIEKEDENLLKLAVAKAGTLDQHLGRIRESVLQLQDFAGQAVMDNPEDFALNGPYIASFPGLKEGEEMTFEHSVWYVGLEGVVVGGASADGCSLAQLQEQQDTPS